MEDELLRRKLEAQENPQIVFSDIDGTLFSPNLHLLIAPLYNVQTAAFLFAHHIPFVVVTGRSFWRKIDQYHLKLLGLPKPDAVITANGTLIYYQTHGGYISDFVWQGSMQSTKITNSAGHVFSWNKWEIASTLIHYLESNKYIFHLAQGNTYLIRIRVDNLSMQDVLFLKKEFTQLFPKGIRVILTEKLLWTNTKDIFSGEFLITPATAGKDNAIQHVLKNLATSINQPIHAYIFGDASVDIPMLLMKNNPKYFTLSTYAVHPTPLTRKIIEENLPKNPHVHLLLGDGPKEILWTLKPQLKPRDAQPREVLSPGQNNKARNVLRKFEWALDKLIDKNLSPNEISLLGLEKLSKGLAVLNKKDSSLLHKTKGWYQYAFGNMTDILDGIRARNSDKKEENGQLVDGFADRAKEFMQLFGRAKKRKDDEEIALATLLAAFSCTLPSIARAQVETWGKTVAEKDEKGGSMIDRTKRLFLSLLFETVGMPDQSLEKDKEIFTTNIATYNHRLSFVKKISLEKIDISLLSDFQKKALERFLSYVSVLQQENIIIKKYLINYPQLLKAYEKESVKLAKDYLELPLSKLRKKWGIKDYKLSIKNYL